MPIVCDRSGEFEHVELTQFVCWSSDVERHTTAHRNIVGILNRNFNSIPHTICGLTSLLGGMPSIDLFVIVADRNKQTQNAKINSKKIKNRKKEKTRNLFLILQQHDSRQSDNQFNTRHCPTNKKRFEIRILSINRVIHSMCEWTTGLSYLLSSVQRQLRYQRKYWSEDVWTRTHRFHSDSDSDSKLRSNANHEFRFEYIQIEKSV